MTARNMRPLIAVFALLMSMLCAADAQACTSCGTPAISYYQPATYSASYQPAAYTAAYQPVAYQSYYSGNTYTGWYPGYWMDRWSARVSSPRVYTAAYQPAYTVGYQPAYTAGYATSYAPSYSGCSSCSSYSASYSPCSSCNTVQQVTMMPVASSGCGCDTCGSACSSCGSSGVSQAAYIQSAVQPAAGCSSCGQSAATGTNTFVPAPNNVAPIQSAPQGGQQQLEPTPATAPAIPPGQPVAPDRTDVNRPVENGVQPPPAGNGAQGQPGGQPESTGSGTNQNN